MTIRTLGEPLKWPARDLPMHELDRDWQGRRVDPPARFALVQDPHQLWLMAAHQRAPQTDPALEPGAFHEGLWADDVAELFLAGDRGAGYLEFNLSPAGAWWVAAFSGPRVRRPLDELPDARSHATTDSAGADSAGAWCAALAIPLDWLRREIGWGEGAKANVTLILESPRQRFLSACDLGSGEPDFHRPQHFATLEFIASA